VVGYSVVLTWYKIYRLCETTIGHSSTFDSCTDEHSIFQEEQILTFVYSNVQSLRGLMPRHRD